MGGYVHIAVPDLFLSGETAARATEGMELPALETFLARAEVESVAADSLEAWICRAFGVDDGAVAPVTLLADGGQPGAAYWLRADPVHLTLRGNEMILRPLAALTADEAGEICETLNQHFATDGLHFLAPHPLRWYLRLERAPEVEMRPIAHVAGLDIRTRLPQGPGALAWHRLFNEIQMVLHGHPVNDARELRGEWSINSIWPWGGGSVSEGLHSPYATMCADSELAAAFARVAGITYVELPSGDVEAPASGDQATLVVWDGLNRAAQHGDLGEWRDSLQAFEHRCVRPMLRALREGRVERLVLEALQPGGSWRYTLTRRAMRRFWRRRKRVGQYPHAV